MEHTIVRNRNTTGRANAYVSDTKEPIMKSSYSPVGLPLAAAGA
jgi:hypothetical protein